MDQEYSPDLYSSARAPATRIPSHRQLVIPPSLPEAHNDAPPVPLPPNSLYLSRDQQESDPHQCGTQDALFNVPMGSKPAPTTREPNPTAREDATTAVRSIGKNFPVSTSSSSHQFFQNGTASSRYKVIARPIPRPFQSQAAARYIPVAEGAPRLTGQVKEGPVYHNCTEGYTLPPPAQTLPPTTSFCHHL